VSGTDEGEYKVPRFSAPILAGAATAIALVASVGSQPVAAVELVSIYGSWTGPMATAMQQELDQEFGAASGIRVKYTPLANFDSSIGAVLKSNAKPNLVLWDEPENLRANAAQLVPLKTVLGADGLNTASSSLAYGWSKVAEVNTQVMGLPIAASPRDLVFANPRAFKELKLKLPQNDGELQSLQASVIKSGLAWPWCLGIEAGSATGFPLDEWMKAYVLRFGGVGKYDAWLHGSLIWSKGVVTAAGNRVAQNFLAPGAVLGGGPGAGLRNFGATTAAGLFASNKAAGQCMYLMGSLNTVASFPASVQQEIASGKSNSIKVFQLPTPVGGTQATLVSGVLASVALSTPGTVKVASYLVGNRFGTHVLARQGWIFNPHYNFPVATYPGALRQAVAAILYSSKSIGFDEVLRNPAKASGVIWSNLTQWFEGKVTMVKAFSTIDSMYHG
jgi:alpha-glucoside transport system substrate-binding protein